MLDGPAGQGQRRLEETAAVAVSSYLVLPPLTGIAPGLAIAAAIGLILIQIGGAIVHLRRGEASVIWLNLVLLILAAVAAWLATVWL